MINLEKKQRICFSILIFSITHSTPFCFYMTFRITSLAYGSLIIFSLLSAKWCQLDLIFMRIILTFIQLTPQNRES
jgi:hypothetical protein